MSVDILIPVRNQYLLIRQLFESICLKIPNKEIGKIIIVDDHSSDRRQINYLKYLFEKGKIHFVRNGIPLPSHYSKIPLSFLKSKGHGGSLNLGLEYVTAEYV
ncbi:MAG: glycosyltransferase, partial [Spirochaetes bacterium]|nr:glycosyltransferase [Spirochaetota bacterium]